MTTDRVDKIVESLELPIQLYYKDKNELSNYSERGSYFWHMDHKKAITKMTKNALEHGLSQELIPELLENCSAWEVITETERQQILSNFKAHTFPELAISDFIAKAYMENESLTITELTDTHERLMKLGPKDSADSMKKFHKIVTLSLVKEFNPVRLSYPGERSTIIISDDIYIRPKNSEIYFSSSSNGMIRTTLNKVYNNGITSKQKDEIIRQILDLCDVIDFESATRYIKFQNDFVFDTKTQEIVAFNPDFFIIKIFDFNYDPNAKCEKWLSFLHSSIESSDIQVLQEFIGYIFYNDLPAQNFLVLKGPTRSGKGTTLRVIMKMLGRSNFSSVPAFSLFSLDDAGHNLASLEGKMANIDGEVPPQELKNIANMKKLSGKDPIWANEKYQIPHMFLYTGKLIFALNSLPKIKLNDEEVDSFFSRILIINYLKSHVDDQNTNLDNELAGEISGIFNWAMGGLKRSRSNNFRFSVNQNLEQKQRLYTLESDPLKVFSDEKIIPGDCEYEPKDLYSIFIKFCSDNSIDPSMNVKTLLSFQRQISNILKVREDLQFDKIREGHDKTTYYKGFCIKDHPEDNKGSDKFNLDSLPDGRVKQSLIEEQEFKELEKKKSEEKAAEAGKTGNSKSVKKSIHYFQVNTNFDKYGYKFFQNSDIEVQSSRVYYYKDSTKIKYMLYQLLMPEEPENTPDGWFSFINKDASELK